MLSEMREERLQAPSTKTYCRLILVWQTLYGTGPGTHEDCVEDGIVENGRGDSTVLLTP